MGKLFATIHKELLLLFRDRAGLLVLFLMPAALVVIVSLVQENVLQTTGESGIRVLFVDRDRELLGKTFEEQLTASGAVQVVKGSDEMDGEAARKALADGEFQFGIIVPEGLTEAVQKRVEQQIRSAFHSDSDADAVDTALPEPPSLTVYFDPLVQGVFRAAVLNALHRVLLTAEMEMKAIAFSQVVPGEADRILQTLMGPSFPEGLFPRVDPAWGRERLLAIQARQAGRGGFLTLPSSVQQNVPAWALFGMFFIVVPLGGSIINERQGGTLKRLMTLPVPSSVLLLGKVLAFVLICLLQFGVILLIGIYLMPMLGTAELEMGTSYGTIALVVVSAALAASGYGILLGVVATTYEQVSMFGPVSIVIAAALGGIMIPVYAMPELMQEISRFSPLGWGLNALTDLFAREGTFRTVLPEIAFLLTFAAGTMTAGWWRFRRMRIE